MKFRFALDTINEAAAAFWQSAGAATVFAFHAGMGAGKTTFIHALCAAKKVRDVVGSPTFSIINEYVYDEAGIEKKIYHMDLYRLKNEEEAIQAGVEDCLYSDHLCLVEWPDKAPGIFPTATVDVYIDIISAETRELKISNI